MAPPKSSSFSVSVVLPASGWEIMANVLRFSTSSVRFIKVSLLFGCCLCDRCCDPFRFILVHHTEEMHDDGFTPGVRRQTGGACQTEIDVWNTDDEVSVIFYDIHCSTAAGNVNHRLLHIHRSCTCGMPHRVRSDRLCAAL